MARKLLHSFLGSVAGNDILFYLTTSTWTVTTIGAQDCLKAPAGDASHLFDAENQGDNHLGEIYLVLWLYVDGTLGATDIRTFLDGLGQDGVAGRSSLRIEAQTTTTYKIAYYDRNGVKVSATGATYNVGAWVKIRYDRSNAGTQLMRININGTQEFKLTGMLLDFFTTTLKPPNAGDAYDFYFRGAKYSSSDTAQQDRPGTDIKGYYIGPNADVKSDEYGDQADCAVASTTGTYERWDDWNTTTADGDTTYNCAQGGEAAKEISGLQSIAIDTALNFDGTVVSHRARDNITGKTTNVGSIIRDSVSLTELENLIGDFLATSYTTVRSVWQDPPAGSWSDYIASATFNHASATKKLQVGARSPNTNGASDFNTAVGLELVLCDTDAPPVSVRRREAPALGSANMMVT